jgi:hypothetical protein
MARALRSEWEARKWEHLAGREFESRKPYRLHERLSIWQQTEEEFFLWDPELTSLDDIPDEELVDFQRMKAMKEPSTIEEYVEWCAEEGTHSLMDIQRVGEAPGFGIAAPPSNEQLVEFFSTDKPSRSMIEDRLDDLMVLRERWQATYVVAYKEGIPDEILFTGYSGD